MIRKFMVMIVPVVLMLGLLLAQIASAALNITENFESGTNGIFTTANGYGTTNVDGINTSNPDVVMATSKSEFVISGTYSLAAFSAGGNWSLFFRTDLDKVKLEAEKTYVLKFDYKVIEDFAAEDGYYWIATRNAASNFQTTVTWLTIKDVKKGDTGTFEGELETKEHSDISILIGSHKGGGISIDNVSIKEKVEVTVVEPISEPVKEANPKTGDAGLLSLVFISAATLIAVRKLRAK